MSEGDPETAWRCAVLNAVGLCVLCTRAGSDYGLLIPVVDSAVVHSRRSRACSTASGHAAGTGRNTSYAPNAPAKLRRPLAPVEIVSVPSRTRTRFPHVHRSPTWPALGADDFHIPSWCRILGRVEAATCVIRGYAMREMTGTSGNARWWLESWRARDVEITTTRVET
ncbi:hypothetical protein EXIGLDRAFT_138418 [Exidia glandulosa HHB12029]|uniref:Uncharacterized protein n=1 Tax=Exidia glandulosa HHB12029 TaxID=1314781 RepID=A0A165FZS6_EXIGL|nr:hypothetical protein EXIGLDRAFT_138418 [Exidia glandulosa HHB12029]